MPRLLKIGFTTRKVEDRVRERNSQTGVPAPFQIEAYFASENPQLDEKLIHELFADEKANGKEFFELSLYLAYKDIGGALEREAAFKSDSLIELIASGGLGEEPTKKPTVKSEYSKTE